MPKKRFTNQYSKPPSTVHPSLSSTAHAGSSGSHAQHASPSVNDLINSYRKSVKSSGPALPSPTPTLPPQIRHLLSQPETPTPAPRSRRRRVDAEGRRLPAGPPPPRSWLERSKHAPGWMKNGGDGRVYPEDFYHLPGLHEHNRRSLQSMCMRQIARHWEYVRKWEQNNLAELPTVLRMELLSHIATEGPDNGVGFDGLRSIVTYPDDFVRSGSPNISPALQRTTVNTIAVEKGPEEDWDAESPGSPHSLESNDNFFRLDLSGSMGHSVSFKQLAVLLEQPVPSLPPLIPHLTHLSLSHPAKTISWRSLLSFSKHVPSLTHLSLTHWPTPTLTPNSRAAVMSSQYGKDIQYGGTHYYSHTLDNDFREAADVLRRLAGRLYSLEYLDVSGCTDWIRALTWAGINEDSGGLDTRSPSLNSPRMLMVDGIDWRSSWLKLSTLKVNGNVTLSEDSHYTSISSFAKGVKEAKIAQRMLSWWMKRGGRAKRGVWVDVVSDDPEQYTDLWRGRTEEERKNRGLLEVLSDASEIDSEISLLNEILDEGLAGLHDAEAGTGGLQVDGND